MKWLWGLCCSKKEKKKHFLRKHESLLHEFVWLNLSSFKDVMAGCMANLCWRNSFIIPEPWLGTFDLFFPLFCPLNQHADNTVAAVVLKMMQSSHAGQDSLFSSCFLPGLWQLWAFVCVTYRNKGGFRRTAAWLGGADTIKKRWHSSHFGRSSPQLWAGLRPTRKRSSQVLKAALRATDWCASLSFH